MSLVTVNGGCLFSIWTGKLSHWNEWKSHLKNIDSVQPYPTIKFWDQIFPLIRIHLFEYGNEVTLPILRTMSIVFVLCTLITKSSYFGKVANQRKASNFFPFNTNKYRSKCLRVIKFWVNFGVFLYPSQANCLRIFCLEQSYWVATSWLILASTGWIMFSKVIVVTVCIKEIHDFTEMKLKNFRKLFCISTQRWGCWNFYFTIEDREEVRQWKYIVD